MIVIQRLQEDGRALAPPEGPPQEPLESGIVVQKSRNLLIADQILRNAAMAVPGVSRWRARRGRTSAAEVEPSRQDLDRYAYSVFDLVVSVTGSGGLEGACVAEIGPGDHVPAALLFLAAGASRYVAVDRFAGNVTGPAGRRLYEALARDVRRSRPGLAPGLGRLGTDLNRLREAGLVERVPRAIERWHAPRSADVLVSYNVLEHVRDMRAAASNTYAALRPGGVAIHRVDFDAHDVWSERDDPFEWLRVSDTVWGLMGSRRGCPNRLRYHEVLGDLQAEPWEVEAQVQDRFDMDAVIEARPWLAHRFRSMPLDSLAVRTARFVCRKR